MRRAALLSVWLGAAACMPPVVLPPDDGGTEPPDAGVADAGTPTRVRLATFNVRRFFDTVCHSGMCGAQDFELAPSQLSFDQRATQLATAVRNLNADVVALQEIETQDCLDALRARLMDTLPHATLGETGGPASLDVAVLSRTAIERVVGHRQLTSLQRPDGSLTSFSRELLEVEVRTTTGLPMVVFAAHFRSKVNDDPGRRLAEAQVARRVVEQRAQQSPGALVVLGGDLNDTPDSEPLLALTSNQGLLRVAADLPPDQQNTYTFAGQGQAIDHLLLAPAAAGEAVPRSARAWKDGASGYGGSDHAALTADFDLR